MQCIQLLHLLRAPIGITNGANFIVDMKARKRVEERGIW